MQYAVGGEKEKCGCVSVSTDTHRGKEGKEERMEGKEASKVRNEEKRVGKD